MISVDPSLPANGVRLSVAFRKAISERKREKECVREENPAPSKLSTKMESASKVSDASSSVMITSGASGRVNALLSLRVLKGLVMLLQAVLLLLLFPFQLRRRRVSTEKTKEEKREISSHRKGAVLRVSASIAPRRKNSSISNSVIVGNQDGSTRRAIAIKRVEQDEDGFCCREFSFFVNSRCETLFTQSWTPISVKVRGLVVILHGLNEHSGRYDKFAKQLNAEGYKVFGMDWVGHGGSDGLHAYVHSLEDAVNDTKQFIEKVLVANPGFQCFLFGHSTGGAIILKAVLDPKVATLVQGMVLTSPAVRVQPSHPIVGLLAPVFSFFMPKFQFSAAANKSGPPVSRDPEALVIKYSDPLVYTGSIRVRTGYEILRISTYLQQHLSRVKTPFLVMHGTADTVTDPEASYKLYEEASSTDKSIKLYEGFLHDLLFEPEPEREAIAKDIICWLNSKLKG